MKTNTLLALVTFSGISVGCGTNPSAGPLADTSTGTGTSSGTNTAVGTSTETAKTETAANTETKTASEEKDKPETKKEDEKKPSKPTLALDQTKLTFADVVRSIGSDEKTLKFTSDLDIPDLNITVTSGSVTTNTSAGPFLITSSCSSIKKGETCTITIKASGTTVGSSTGALKVGTKSGAELASVDLAVDVTMMGVKKVVPGPQLGATYIFNDGTAKMWGAITRVDETLGYAIPNAEFINKLRSDIASTTTIYVKALPVVLPDNAKVVDMVWLGNNGCALDDRKRLVCWGFRKSYSGITVSSIMSRPEVVATDVMSIGAAGIMMCWLDVGSKAWCTGTVNLGNSQFYTDVLSTGSSDTLQPKALAPAYSFDYLTAGGQVLCGKVKGEEKVVCGGYAALAFGATGTAQYYPYTELDLSLYSVSGPIKDIKTSGDSICILSDNLGCAGSSVIIGSSGGTTPSYSWGFQPKDKTGAKIKPTKLWGMAGSTGASYCAQEASGRVLCWGRPNRSLFNDPGVTNQSLIPTEQTVELNRTPEVSGSAGVAQIGKFDIKATWATFSSANNWGLFGYATITPDDPMTCQTRTGDCY